MCPLPTAARRGRRPMSIPLVGPHYLKIIGSGGDRARWQRRAPCTAQLYVIVELVPAQPSLPEPPNQSPERQRVERRSTLANARGSDSGCTCASCIAATPRAREICVPLPTKRPSRGLSLVSLPATAGCDKLTAGFDPCYRKHSRSGRDLSREAAAARTGASRGAAGLLEITAWQSNPACGASTSASVP